jgi:RNA polymerase sigma-70 factor (ECF subfamily)
MQPTFDGPWRARALAGDPDAVRALTDRALPALYRFCLYRVGRDVHLCEEVVQDTLVHALRDLHRYDPGRADNQIMPWLTGLARNAIQRALNRHRSTVPLDALWARADEELRAAYERLESEPVAGDLLERAETCELVNATMAQLPPHYRDALEAKYLDGRSMRDLASARQTTEKAVESLLSRARAAFRVTFRTLARNFDAEPV